MYNSRRSIWAKSNNSRRSIWAKSKGRAPGGGGGGGGGEGPYQARGRRKRERGRPWMQRAWWTRWCSSCSCGGGGAPPVAAMLLRWRWRREREGTRASPSVVVVLLWWRRCSFGGGGAPPVVADEIERGRVCDLANFWEREAGAGEGPHISGCNRILWRTVGGMRHRIPWLTVLKSTTSCILTSTHDMA